MPQVDSILENENKSNDGKRIVKVSLRVIYASFRELELCSVRSNEWFIAVSLLLHPSYPL